MLSLLCLASLAACEQTITFPLPSVTSGGAAIEIDGMLYPGMASIQTVAGATPSRMVVLTTSDFAYQFQIRPDPAAESGADFPTGQTPVATSSRAGFSLERLVASAASEGFGFVSDGTVATSGSMSLQQSTATAITGTLEVQMRAPSDTRSQRVRIRFAAIR